MLVVHARIAERDTDQEAVELGFGKRKRALELDRVLRGQDEERFGEHGRLAIDRDLVFFHRFEKGRLGAWRGPVDLVGQEHLGEHRTRTELEVRRVLVVHARAGDVGGKNIRRELDPAETTAHCGCQRTRQQRFADPRDVLDKGMALAQQCDQKLLQSFPVAHDHGADCSADTTHRSDDG